jgi:lactate dehydrogenase-like 2-hydroxyacid dehydrogenase
MYAWLEFVMKILILNDREPIDTAVLAPLEKHHEVILFQSGPDDFDIQEALKKHHDATILVTTYMPLSADNLSKLHALKRIVATTTALEYIDLDYCQRHGIRVTNNTGYTGAAVAEHLLALMLATGRRLVSLDKGVRQGDFNQFEKMGFEFQGKTLGVMGFGYIGQRFARYAEALGMTIIYLNRRTIDSDYKQVSFDELIAQSDVIALTLPLTKETHHMIDKSVFSKMKDGVILVSISGDEIIHPNALVHALETGKVFGAGLDRHEKGEALNHFENVILTPTKAWYTKECMQRRNETWIKTLLAE